VNDYKPTFSKLSVFEMHQRLMKQSKT